MLYRPEDAALGLEERMLSSSIDGQNKFNCRRGMGVAGIMEEVCSCLRYTNSARTLIYTYLTCRQESLLSLCPMTRGPR